MTDGFGAITWWGFSPAIDLLESVPIRADDNKPVNVLLIGAGDLRHVLKTISYLRRKTSCRRPVHFYIIENNLELYARTILFLTIVLESPDRLGLQEKTELFLELYGNSFLRQQSNDYLQKMSVEFVKWVTDFDLLAEKLPAVDLAQLKYKEVDALEGIFNFWRNKVNREFDIEKCWDLRLREYLGARYDAIPNVFDWDLSMKLHEKDAGIIHTKEYKVWRRTGIAFEIRDGNYNVSNRSLASGYVFKKSDGERAARRGYWGDIIVSPYVTFGIESEEESFFKQSNKQYTKTSTNVSEYNITALIHELVHNENYKLPSASIPEEETATLEEITEEEIGEHVSNLDVKSKDHEDEQRNASSPSDYTSIPLEGVKIHLLPTAFGTELHKKSKFATFFDVAYFSNSMVHLLTPNTKAIFAPEATVILETAKFMLELKPEQCREYVTKVCSMANECGCAPADRVDDVRDTHVKFVFRDES